ncbi:NAD(+) diphosphatase [Nitrincola sp. MINF-07-Sa-05]|uniref:NAD(+) diphosphatase n=1 Tax=Nitrincola salilacus TaxID=3400273 RepID=UPI003917FFAD
MKQRLIVRQGNIYTDEAGQYLWREGDEQINDELLRDVMEARYQLADTDIELLIPATDDVPGLQAGNLRSLLSLSAQDEYAYALLSRASQLSIWHDQHRYCGRCGTETLVHHQDLAKVCPACDLAQYPRISPCIIVLVMRGDECLLANGANFPPGRFSTLAGFIEAGESAEQAVAREIREEVGIEVSNIRFFSSQSWPFPHALMLGFFADHLAGELKPDGVEILDARWFRRDAMPDMPPSFSISRQLIDHYLAMPDATSSG